MKPEADYTEYPSNSGDVDERVLRIAEWVYENPGVIFEVFTDEEIEEAGFGELLRLRDFVLADAKYVPPLWGVKERWQDAVMKRI